MKSTKARATNLVLCERSIVEKRAPMREPSPQLETGGLCDGGSASIVEYSANVAGAAACRTGQARTSVHTWPMVRRLWASNKLRDRPRSRCRPSGWRAVSFDQPASLLPEVG